MRFSMPIAAREDAAPPVIRKRICVPSRCRRRRTQSFSKRSIEGPSAAKPVLSQWSSGPASRGNSLRAIPSASRSTRRKNCGTANMCVARVSRHS